MKLAKATQKQFTVFLFVGAINTIFGYSIFYFFIFLNLSYYLSFLIASLFGLIFNFMTTGRIVFKSKNIRLFYKYILTSIILYFLYIGLFKIINGYINNFYISGLITMMLTAFLSFYLNKKIFITKVTVNNIEGIVDKKLNFFKKLIVSIK